MLRTVYRAFGSGSGSTGRATTGGQRIVESLVAADIRKVFGIPGTHLKSIYRALEDRQHVIQHVTMRHEQGAGFAAEGHARATGDLAVALVMTGVGFTNVLTPMAVALADSIPLLVISSEVPTFWSQMPQRQFSHFVPHVSQQIASPVSKQSYQISCVDEIERTVSSAISLARHGRPGPVHINIPIDLLNSISHVSGSAIAQEEPVPSAALSPMAQAALASFAAKLASCERPLIIAGGGAANASNQLLRFAETLGAPVLMTVAGKGCIDERHGLSVGARLHTPAARDYLMSQADALILLGTQLSPTDFWHFAYDVDVPLHLNRLGTGVAHIDLDPISLEQGGVEKAGGALVLADVATACEFLEGQVSHLRASTKSWNAEPEAAVSSAKQLGDDSKAMTQALTLDFGHGGEGERMSQMLSKLRSKLSESVPLFVDICRLGYTALSLYPAYRPRSFLYPVGTTCLGYALPAAIGAAVAQPGNPVVVLVGDGGLQFNIQELAVAAEMQLPILIVVWNDSGYGEIRSISGEFETSWTSPDFAKICAGYRIPHILVERSMSVDEAFDSSSVAQLLQGATGPVFVEVAWPPEAQLQTSATRSQSAAPLAPCDVSHPVTLHSSVAELSSTCHDSQHVIDVRPPKLVLGTMTLGWDKTSSIVDSAVAKQIVGHFLSQGNVEIDTARMYSEGLTEQMLAGAVGNQPESLQRCVRLATKANPAAEAGDYTTGGFRAPLISQQFARSLDALNVDCVDLFYLHWPDCTTSMEEALEQVQQAYEEGKFCRFGISNYSPSEVYQIYHFMKERNWVLPTVYQGMYNALTRNVELDLFPVLRELDISFYAFNPLAGGLLTGKHSFGDGPNSQGRFHNNDGYQSRYWKPEYFAAVQLVASEAEAAGISMPDAALRWMVHHSELKGDYDDGLILGCSSLQQLQDNLRGCGSERLPLNLLVAWEEAWKLVEPVCPSFASYGKSASDRVELIIASTAIENDGQRVKVEFGDASIYNFSSAWLRDSSPDLASESFVRADAFDVQMCANTHVTDVSQVDGSILRIAFSDGASLTYRGDWLRAFSPFVAEHIHVPSGSKSGALRVQKKAYLVDELFHTRRHLWESDFQCVSFDANSLVDSSSTSIASILQKKPIFQTLCCDGAVVIRGIEKPSSLEQDQVGEPMERFARVLVGKLYQHPRRKTNYGIMRAKQVTAEIEHLTDYNLSKPLAMHTDHGFLNEGVAGYWQLFHQVRGGAKTKLVNAAAVAAELQRVDPDAYKLLTKINVTHALRTLHYNADGDYVKPLDDHAGVFEDEATHPILSLQKASSGAEYLDRVFHQEIKRGACAVPYDSQEEFLHAYRKWIELLESPRFAAYVELPEDSMLILNNSFVMHGRGIPLCGKERTMVWGYIQKDIVDLSYRLLVQRELHMVHDVPLESSSRIPNHVLMQLLHSYS